MDLQMRVGPALRLQARLTPQLVQLVNLLVLPLTDLRKEMQDALVDYPALEEAPRRPEPSEDRRPEAREDEGDARWLSYLAGGAGRDLSRAAREVEPRNAEDHLPERIPARGRSLAGHLLEQLQDACRADPVALRVGQWIIGNLDESGYLHDEVTSIAGRLGVDPGVVVSVLHRIQHFDPVGVASRGALDSLSIQALARFPESPSLVPLIQRHLSELRAGRYGRIARALGVSVADVLEDEARLRALDPRPARGYGDEETRYVVPDASVVLVDGELVVRMNNEGLPRLRVSASYQSILERPDRHDPEVRAFARSRVVAAKWFLRNVYERQGTIRKVIQIIVRLQRDFLLRGPGHERPLMLREVAELAEVSESTVSRVVARKYIETPRGVFELRRLFWAGLPSRTGDEVAVESVKRQIGRLLEAEDPGRPLSDQEIAARLGAAGVAVARRTVTKYREELGLDASHVRRARRTLPTGVKVRTA